MKKLFLLIFFILGSLLVFKYYSSKTTASGINNADIVLFWGDGCSHCEVVKKYLADNKIENSYKITQLEIYYNQNNKRQLEESASKCSDIDKSKGIGIPFLYIKKTNQCFVGDTPIIDFFKSSPTL